MKYVRPVAVLLVLAIAFQARAADPAAVKQAQRSFDTTDRAKLILGYLHLGGQYKDHECLAAVGVADAKGNLIPGAFCLRYRYYWSIGGYDNKTTIDLLFDANGALSGVNNEDSTSIVSPPYAIADGTVKVLGNALLAAAKNNLKEQDRKFIQNCIDNADAHDLMVWDLKFQYNVLGR
jgi:hypothetical protein